MYLTVKEIAAAAEVSKPTIQKIINSRNIEADHLKGQYRYYNLDQVKEIIKEVDSNFDFSVFAGGAEEPQNLQNEPPKPPTEPQNLQNEPPKPKTEPPKPPTDQDKETLQQALDILRQEIESKNEQIKDLQQQLSAAYTQIGELAKAASYITAADKTEKIIDHQQKDIEKSEKRKKWFQFWKR